MQVCHDPNQIDDCHCIQWNLQSVGVMLSQTPPVQATFQTAIQCPEDCLCLLCPRHSAATVDTVGEENDDEVVDLAYMEFDRSEVEARVPNQAEYFTVLQHTFHVFCDASEGAFGCCMYNVCYYMQGPITVRFIESKARICPAKGKATIPRKELCGMLIGTQLASSVAETYDLDTTDPEKFVFWSDSTSALFWVSTEKKKKVYVSNRCRKILNSTQRGQWRYCPGSLNPADSISRGSATATHLVSDLQYRFGPRFLYEQPFFWPENIIVSKPPVEALDELAKEKDVCETCLVSAEDLAWSLLLESRPTTLAEENLHLTAQESLSSKSSLLKFEPAGEIITQGGLSSKSSLLKFEPAGETMMDPLWDSESDSSILSILFGFLTEKDENTPPEIEIKVAASSPGDNQNHECLRGWHFKKELSPCFHPGNFQTLERFARFHVQVQSQKVR